MRTKSNFNVINHFCMLGIKIKKIENCLFWREKYRKILVFLPFHNFLSLLSPNLEKNDNYSLSFLQKKISADELCNKRFELCMSIVYVMPERRALSGCPGRRGWIGRASSRPPPGSPCSQSSCARPTCAQEIRWSKSEKKTVRPLYV